MIIIYHFYKWGNTLIEITLVALAILLTNFKVVNKIKFVLTLSVLYSAIS